MINRFPTKMNSLSHIKEFLNDEIKTIIDVGIQKSTIELKKIFLTEKHILIEPVNEYFEEIRKNYTDSKIDFDLLEIAASNHKGKQKLEKRNHLPELGKKFGGVTASNLIFNNQECKENQIIVDTDTIDNIKRNYTGPFLVKIDVDGAEFQILEGLTECHNVMVVVVECWLNRISDFQNIMFNKGFVLYDITDLCYLRGQLNQIDLIFINKKIIGNENYPEITPREFGHTSAQKGNYLALREEHLDDDKRIQNLIQIAKTGKIN